MAVVPKTKPKAAAQEAVTEVNPKAPAVVSPTLKITGQPEKAYRAGCARANWWDRFCKFDGKPLAELETSCYKDPPSLPKKAEGDVAKAEKFSGWLSFFKDERKNVRLT